MSDSAPHSGKIWVVLPAGGAGVRMGEGTRKQYVEVSGKPILEYTLDVIEACAWVAGAILVLPPEDCSAFAGLSSRYRRLKAIVAGGKSRFQSVRNGVLALAAAPEDWVLVHDAVRPLFSEALCLRVLSAAMACGAAIAALPLKGTIKEADGASAGHRVIARTVDRSALWEAQTPQAFSYGALCEVYARAGTWREDECERVTDEAYLFEAFGKAVALVEGEETNIKITRPLDLKLMQAFLHSEGHSERSAL